jgi:hypothetical protein
MPSRCSSTKIIEYLKSLKIYNFDLELNRGKIASIKSGVLDFEGTTNFGNRYYMYQI